MAINISSFKFFQGKQNKKNKTQPEAHQTTMIMEGLRKISGREAGRTALIGHLPIERQYLITIISLLVFLLLAAGVLIYNTLTLSNKAGYITTATEMQMLSQRLAKGAQQAVLGNPEAFKQLKDSKIKFDTE